MGKRMLHVGCGPVHLPPAQLHALGVTEEVRVDLDPEAKPDIVADLGAIPEPACSADVVFASHCLEHVPWPRVQPVLEHWHALLRHDGVVHVRVPDLFQVCKGVIASGLDTVAYTSPAGPVTYRSMLYGHEPDVGSTPGMRHLTGFTGQTLAAVLAAAGFHDVEVEVHPYELRGEAKVRKAFVGPGVKPPL